MYKNNPDRQTNDTTPKIRMRDQNVPYTWFPTKESFNPFVSTQSKYLSFEGMINHELQEKYIQKHQGTLHANVEMKSIPRCFDNCVTDLEDSFLIPEEKNCIRECYFKRINAKNDFQFFAVQMLAKEKSDSIKHAHFS
ncbi:unnamed protein product [Moneuplotes crassus]|uniref:Uncharacterized protein n=1 Tax=Euplotes crassus TaxID=5936 RepID=A0AAD1Y4N3_EUPCR|nr:unnamed protein product [Moneuplotes crassus]